MRALIIPDIHLKPDMFKVAEAHMQSGAYDIAVFLGDFCDDWGQQNNIGLYEKTLDALDQFLEKYSNSLVCWGNHDLAYIWGIEDHPGFSAIGEPIIRGKLNALDRKYPGMFSYVHRVDDVLFSHAGITSSFIYSPMDASDVDFDQVIEAINDCGKITMWGMDSPVWARPDQTFVDSFLQIVGHSPVRKAEMYKPQLLLCDVFSTEPDGSKYGSELFTSVDTVTQQWSSVQPIPE